MKKEHDCEIPFSLPTMNPPFIFSQRSSFGLGSSVGENPESSVSFPGEMAALSQPLDELSAIIQKYNVMGSGNPFVSMDTSLVRMSGGVTSDSNKKEDGTHPGWNNEEGGGELQSSCRRSHNFSERQRRSDMNRLLEQMHSLLPNPTAKKEKTSILAETISYIESLQQQLANYSGRFADTQLQNHTNTDTVKCESLSSVQEILQRSSSSSDCLRSSSLQYLSSKNKEENLLVNCIGTDIFITINCANKVNLLPSIIFTVESHGIQVVDVFVSATNARAFHFLRVKAAHILNPAARETLHLRLKKLIDH
ncbi:anthocyanin regulatory R-S protein-like [Cryptomeria japonica]|uniref:anthocyanin regulatory R-S protein-like n=1 Tax=Cryptomeria japonica TaxID=3369 RepID=UPI0027DA6F82|nr:anthocyanin regulatory R-S protein-like [Cryptomeria japonica]